MKKTGSNINTIKDDNNSLIFDCIRKRPMSRAEISKITGLSKSAVTIIVKHLIDDGKIYETSTEETAHGRPPILLDIVDDYRYAMGFFINRKVISVCVVNLKFKIIGELSCDIKQFSRSEDALDWALENGRKILADNNIPEEKCIGIGIGSPGPLDYQEGIVFTPPNFELFRNFNIKKYLSSVCDWPIFLNNAPVLMAMYDAQKREYAVSDFIFIVVDHGVGSAIIQNDSVYRGSKGLSGEIGHISIDCNGPECSCGNNGCLESYISRKAIEKRFSKNYEDIIDGAYDNNLECLEAVEYIAKVFSAGIINAVNLLDCESVVVRGELNYRHRLLFDKIQKHIDEKSVISKAHTIKIYPSLITDNDSIAYTTSIILRKYFNQKL